MSEKHSTDIECPFCGEDGFDKIGLKDHLQNHCDDYDNTDRIKDVTEQTRFICPVCFKHYGICDLDDPGRLEIPCDDCRLLI